MFTSYKNDEDGNKIESFIQHERFITSLLFPSNNLRHHLLIQPYILKVFQELLNQLVYKNKSNIKYIITCLLFLYHKLQTFRYSQYPSFSEDLRISFVRVCA